MNVFYRPEMYAETQSFSPSSRKPKLFVERLQEKAQRVNQYDPLKPPTIQSFEPATYEDLCLAHDPDYVKAILSCEIDNGFGNRDQAVADSLPYTVGSMISAAEYATVHRGRLPRAYACSPTSGFHHAGYDFSGGFCTFNGLMVAAMKLKNEGLVNKVGILDCDVHYGNGTDDIIKRKKLTWVKHHTSGKHFGHESKSEKFFDWLASAVDDLMDCDVVLYQAGMDMNKFDPLGGFLSDTGLMQRDQIVSQLRRVAWNLAGGYQERINSVLDGHIRTYKEFQ